LPARMLPRERPAILSLRAVVLAQRPSPRHLRGKPGGTFRRRGQYLFLAHAQVRGRVGPVLDVSKNVRC
jgi:hypothetical protein